MVSHYPEHTHGGPERPYICWSIERDGICAASCHRTTFAGTPATTLFGGTSFRTTLAAATWLMAPILTFPKTLAPHADHDALCDLGMSVPGLIAGAAQGHVLNDRDVIVDHHRLTDHDAGPVVEQNAVSKAGGGVNIGTQNQGHPVGQPAGEVRAPVLQEAMRYAMGLHRNRGMCLQDVGKQIRQSGDLNAWRMKHRPQVTRQHPLQRWGLLGKGRKNRRQDRFPRAQLMDRRHTDLEHGLP